MVWIISGLLLNTTDTAKYQTIEIWILAINFCATLVFKFAYSWFELIISTLGLMLQYNNALLCKRKGSEWKSHCSLHHSHSILSFQTRFHKKFFFLLRPHPLVFTNYYVNVVCSLYWSFIILRIETNAWIF